MSKTVKTVNPYRKKSAYNKIFADLASCPKTKESLMKRHTLANIGVVISPRAEDECRGDCRGNLSAKGHIYYSPRTKGKDGVTRYGVCIREVELEQKKRSSNPKIASGKASTKIKEKETVKA